MVLWNDVVLVVLQYVEGGKMRDLPVDNRNAVMASYVRTASSTLTRNR